MSEISRSDFSKLFCVSKPYITKAVSQGKLILNDEFKIDLSLNENKLFIRNIKPKSDEVAKLINEFAPIGNIEPIEPKNNDQELDFENPTPKKQGNARKRKDSQDVNGFDIVVKTKQAELDKKLAETERIRLQISKLRGETIPVDYVKSIVSILSSSLINSYKNEVERIVMEFSKRKKMTTQEQAEMKSLIVKKINVAHDEAVNVAKSELESLIDKSVVDEDV